MEQGCPLQAMSWEDVSFRPTRIWAAIIRIRDLVFWGPELGTGCSRQGWDLGGDKTWHVDL
jgi:hypothetical protein